MIKTIKTWLIQALLLIGCTYLIDGIKVESFFSALLMAAVLGLVNAVLRPVLSLFAFPFIALTLGLSTFIIDALLLWLSASVVPGFSILSLYAALKCAIVLAIANWLLNL